MASIQMFNAETIDPRMKDFEILPEGNYRLEATESDLVATKNGTGQILKMTYRVIEGPHEGSSIWHNINYVNASAKAQEIGQREFSALCHAVGVLSVTETEDLHFKPFTAKVGIEPAQGEYKAKNKIVKIFWDGLEAPPPGASASPPATPQTAAPARAATVAASPAKPAGARPWGKK